MDNNSLPQLDLDLDLSDAEDGATAKRGVATRLKAEKAKREIRPLRRSASRGGATQSLPPSMFRFSHETSNVKPIPTITQITEEDDWSDSFGLKGTAPTADLEL